MFQRSKQYDPFAKARNIALRYKCQEQLIADMSHHDILRILRNETKRVLIQQSRWQAFRFETNGADLAWPFSPQGAKS